VAKGQPSPKEITMNKKALIALATGLLLAGATAASAAGTQSSSSSTAAPKSSASSTMSRSASDMLSLTGTQQKSAWKDLGKSSSQSAPSGFRPMVGAVVPSAIKIEAVPSKAATDVPQLKPYDFAVVQGKLLIVNPADKKIAEVITG
jgi:Protein of unknown function (DUF1236)